MTKRPSRAGKAPRLRPLDHLRPGERPPADLATEAPPPPDVDRDEVAGKATRSPAAVETREHLEGSEQGPV